MSRLLLPGLLLLAALATLEVSLAEEEKLGTVIGIGGEI
jgi:hypothetical protein